MRTIINLKLYNYIIMENNNIFRVLNENDLVEILNSYTTKMIVISFISKTSDTNCGIKKALVKLSQENPENIFLYIDVHNYLQTNSILINHIQGVPTTFFYYANEEIACAKGNHISDIVDTFYLLIKKISPSQEQKDHQDSPHEIAFKKLNEVKQQLLLTQLERLKKMKEIEESK